jgi:ribosomal RNA assembly protein
MVEEIYVEKIREILRNKKLIEKDLNLKLTNRGKNFFVKGKVENEYLGIKVFEAVNHGFSVEEALDLKQEGIIFQTINIKDLTKRTDLERVRGRIIGTRGKTLNTLKKLTGCNIALSDNHIGIIGSALAIEDAVQALTSLVQGSKQGNVYARLERHKKEKLEEPGIGDIEEVE